VTRAFLLLIGIATIAPAWTAWADGVVPSERVRSRVMVREGATAESHSVGSLQPGERAELLGQQPDWRRVRLEDGTEGFVSATWTVVISEPQLLPPVALRKEPRGGLLRGLQRLFRSDPGVEFLLRTPRPDQRVYRNRDPTIPSSGFATALASRGDHDVVLVLDASTSTNEWAEVDVDGDGHARDTWRGGDSIFQAQIQAARNFLGILQRLPGNREYQRIRVGIVTFAGDASFRRRPADEHFQPSANRIYLLAARDAELRLPLTSDYDAAERALRELAQTEPSGMTDLAAGIARATIELEGMSGLGARSDRRANAQKVIVLMTDGKPRLPYDRARAEKAAVYAGRMASQFGIRINAFELGRNVVTESTNDSIERMARRSGGRFLALEHPGDIVSALDVTAFTCVDRVKIINRSTQRETRYMATGIDGSFYGEIDLEEGPNEIELVAVLLDERRTSDRLTIVYQEGPPTEELEQHLASIRTENETLIERIKQGLAREMEQTHTRQQRNIAVSADRGPTRR
jgi:Mg-chelatase subunit ChlD